MLKRTISLGLVTLLAAATAATAGAREIKKAVAEADAGYVHMTYAARDGVCGDGWNTIRIGDSWHCTNWHGSGDGWDRDCDEGPVHVLMKVRRGEVVRIKTRVGDGWSASHYDDLLDLGEVAPQDAADFLLDLAEDERGKVAEEAILPATLARDAEVWPRLMKIARDDDNDDDLRQSAVFWLGHMAGEKATEGLVKLIDDDDEDMDVREAAVFALSQGQGRKSMESLMEIARENPHPQLRRSALFWLAQNDDPEVLDFFEEILLGKN
jgi:HEAT repeat protein